MLYHTDNYSPRAHFRYKNPCFTQTRDKMMKGYPFYGYVFTSSSHRYGQHCHNDELTPIAHIVRIIYHRETHTPKSHILGTDQLH